MSRKRRFCFTINNYSENTLDKIKDLNYSYVIVGKEKGQGGTPHFQGYIEFKNPKTFQAVIGAFEKKAHIEISKGSAEQNQDYCSKQEILFEDGIPFKQGKRNDLKSVRDEVLSGKNIRDLVDSEIIRNYQGLRMAEGLMKYYEKPRDPSTPVELIWCFGKTGSGKSRWAHEYDTEVFKPVSYKWWEGYDGHRSVLLDEIRGDFCKFHEFLKLTDRYGIRVESKGGSRQLVADTILVTSAYHPADLWSTVEDKSQLSRRISKILKFENGKCTEVKWVIIGPLDSKENPKSWFIDDLDD